MWLLGVSRGDTWLFLPDLVEVWDVGACVVRLWSHVVAPVASFPAGSECELQESVSAIAGCACRERGCCFRSCCSWFHLRPARSCGCVAKAERAYDCCLWIRAEVDALLDVPLVVGVCVVLAVCLALCACAPLCAVLCSVDIFARAKQMLVCRVALLVEHCDTCLWLLPALCWLVVNSGEVFPEFFFVGSGGGECSESFLSRRVHAEGCFRIVFDFAGSAGVVFGPNLVVGRGTTLFHYFVVLCSRCFSLYYFLE
ncbi:hypothetical protein Taro_032780 [Colocasia esculenta]|uniref:Uncharacterized protein n=1 Tax=Colocasia esculenta TaxID=4460 RepID=A0A843W2V5_COLES|nr:hypothetical protein [Colocasia esculenta]